MPNLITTLGPKGADELGLILPHEHVFVDLRTPDQPGYAQADPADVVRVMKPELVKARVSGVTALVECSTVGVGRRIDILKAVSEATNFPLVVPTGIYREPWVPDWAHRASEEELHRWMLKELTEDIEGTGVQAGFIKLSAGDDGMTASEVKILRAAARAAVKTGAAIGSHTIRGWVARSQVQILDSLKLGAEHFVWIHANAEPDTRMHLDMARAGAWVEFDWIGQADNDALTLRLIRNLLDAGLEDRILLSMDSGWYDPAKPSGGTPNPFTYLSDVFLPKMLSAGIGDQTIDKLTRANPFRAFAR
jgi:phosphotriesterase-related protein